MWPRKATPGWPDVARTHRAAGASVPRKRANAAFPPSKDIQRPAWNVSDHRALPEGRRLDLAWLARFAGQKGDERAQHAAGAPEPSFATSTIECGHPASHR